MLGIECFFGQFQRHMVQLVGGGLRFHLVRFGYEDDHLWNTCMALTDFKKNVLQGRRRNYLESEEIAIKVKSPLLISRPEDDFGDTNDIFHKYVPLVCLKACFAVLWDCAQMYCPRFVSPIH